MGGHDGRQILSSVESYDPERNVWSPVADLSVPRHGAGLGVLDRVLYCVGGRSNTGPVKTVEKYDEVTNTWSLVAEMNHSRSYHGVVCHKGRLYAVGGHDGNSLLSSMEMYDPSTNTWTLVADMSSGRMGPAVALIHRHRNYFIQNAMNDKEKRQKRKMRIERSSLIHGSRRAKSQALNKISNMKTEGKI